MLLATQVRAAGEIGHAVRTAGAPVLLRARRLSPLRARDAVFDGDTVRTDPRSLAELMLAQTTRISLGPSSELKIDSFTANPLPSSRVSTPTFTTFGETRTPRFRMR